MCLRDRSQKQWGNLCSALLLLLTSVAFEQQAKAGFIGEYAVNLFTVTNVNGAGVVNSPDGGASLLIAGPNNGSGLDGFTDVTIMAPRSGLIQFQYTYASLDAPGYDFSGYLLGTLFVPLADTDGQSATVLIPVNQGQMFGFRVGTLDNTGEPGVLTITNFNASGVSNVPEPGGISLLLLAGTAACVYRRGFESRDRAAPASLRSRLANSVRFFRAQRVRCGPQRLGGTRLPSRIGAPFCACSLGAARVSKRFFGLNKEDKA
jgi:hypothetical protein